MFKYTDQAGNPAHKIHITFAVTSKHLEFEVLCALMRGADLQFNKTSLLDAVRTTILVSGMHGHDSFSEESFSEYDLERIEEEGLREKAREYVKKLVPEAYKEV